ncbi:MAG TPA: hypothetical protein VH969_29235 [Actinophytocola sp.]|jgi:hypothetical protein|uniref:hypothetical protein n=1 Tax=Actinophytocola sp. TaxID=1872138 RepID=UPI002F93243E
MYKVRNLGHRARRRLRACLVIAGVVAGLGVVGPATASAAGNVCDFSIENTDNVVGDEVKAKVLQEGGNGDEIFMVVGGNLLPQSGTVQFPTAGTAKPASAFGPITTVRFSDGALSFKFVEDDPIENDRISPKNAFFACEPQSGTLQLVGAGAQYEVEAVVRVVA